MKKKQRDKIDQLEVSNGDMYTPHLCMCPHNIHSALDLFQGGIHLEEASRCFGH